MEIRLKHSFDPITIVLSETDPHIVELLNSIVTTEGILMVKLQDVLDAVAEDKDAVEAAAHRVSDHLMSLSDAVAALQATVTADLQTKADFDAFKAEMDAGLGTIKDGIDSVTLEAAAIDPTP